MREQEGSGATSGLIGWGRGSPKLLVRFVILAVKNVTSTTDIEAARIRPM